MVLCQFSVAPDFVKVSLNETNRMMRMVTDLLLVTTDNETSQLDIEDQSNGLYHLYFLNRFDKIKKSARRYQEV